MSVGVASRSTPYSTSTLFGRSGPLSNWRSLPSGPEDPERFLGAATFMVPSTRLFAGIGPMIQTAGVVRILRQRIGGPRRLDGRDRLRLRRLGRRCDAAVRA